MWYKLVTRGSHIQNTRSLRIVRIFEGDLAIHSGIDVHSDFDTIFLADLPHQGWDKTDVSGVEEGHAGRVIFLRNHVVRLEDQGDTFELFTKPHIEHRLIDALEPRGIVVGFESAVNMGQVDRGVKWIANLDLG